MYYLVLYGQHEQTADLHQHGPALREGAQGLGLGQLWTGAGAGGAPRLLGWREEGMGGTADTSLALEQLAGLTIQEHHVTVVSHGTCNHYISQLIR